MEGSDERPFRAVVGERNPYRQPQANQFIRRAERSDIRHHILRRRGHVFVVVIEPVLLLIIRSREECLQKFEQISAKVAGGT